MLQQTGLDPTIVSVNFVASDGYKGSLSLDEAVQSNVIIAYQLNGSPLSETLRLVMPGYNGKMWISMITSITMSASTTQTSLENGVTVPNIPVWQSLPLPPVQAQILPRKMRQSLSQLLPQQISLNPLSHPKSRDAARIKLEELRLLS